MNVLRYLFERLVRRRVKSRYFDKMVSVMSLETGFKTNLLYTLKELHYYAKERNDVGKKMQGFLQLDK